VQESPPGGRFHVAVHLEEPPHESDPSTLATEAIHKFFRYRAELTRHRLNQSLRTGRTRLAIGLSFAASRLIAADVAGGYTSGTFVTILRESLTIVGWGDVAPHADSSLRLMAGCAAALSVRELEPGARGCTTAREGMASTPIGGRLVLEEGWDGELTLDR